MILEYKVSDIKRLLIDRAKAIKTIKYSEIYNIFTSEEINVKRDIWDTFEEACSFIVYTIHLYDFVRFCCIMFFRNSLVSLYPFRYSRRFFNFLTSESLTKAQLKLPNFQY